MRRRKIQRKVTFAGKVCLLPAETKDPVKSLMLHYKLVPIIIIIIIIITIIIIIIIIVIIFIIIIVMMTMMMI